MYGFSSSHVWMCELDCKESWVPKNCFWTVVLEKTLDSPLDSKEIQPVNPKGNQSWVFIVRTDVEAETPILWPPDTKSWLIGIEPDAGKDWGQEEKGTTEYKMVRWHHRLNRHGFGWTPGFGYGQGGLACCSSWGRKELDTTEWLNGTELNWIQSSDHELIIENLRLKLKKVEETTRLFSSAQFTCSVVSNSLRPHGQYWNQIDYILCSQRWRSSI